MQIKAISNLVLKIEMTLGSGTRKHHVFFSGTCGAMDNASDYGSEDSRFESWQVRFFWRQI